jgi:glycogen(starch) synthase
VRIEENNQVTVIIVTRNRGNEVNRLLTSLQYQSYKNFEVLVIHGPSSSEDRTKEVVANFKSVSYRKFDHKNIAAARNCGVDLALGDFLIFIDDDAIPEPDCIKNCLAEFGEDVGLVAGVVRNPDGITWQYRGGRIDALGEPHHVDYANSVPPKDFTAIGALFACRSSALRKIGGFDEVFSYYLDETEMNLRMSIAGYKSVLAPSFEAIHEQGRGVYRSKDGFPSSYIGIIRSRTYFLLKYSKKFFKAQELFLYYRIFIDSLISRIDSSSSLSSERKKDLISSVIAGIREGVECASNQQHVRKVYKENRAWLPFETFKESVRIVICCRGWNIPDSGIGNWTRLLSESLAQLGHQVTIISETTNPEFVEFLDSGIWVHHINPKTHSNSEVPGHIASRWAAVEMEFLSIVGRRGCDVLQFPIWDLEGFSVEIEHTRIVKVMSLHTTYGLTLSDHPEWMINGFVSKPIAKVLELEKAALKVSDGILANSKAIMDEIENSYSTKIEGNIAVVPHAHKSIQGVDPSSCGVSEIVFIGRLEHRKGIDAFLRAINLIRGEIISMGFQVRVIGSPGYNWKDIKNEFTRDELSWVNFEGFINQADLNVVLSGKPILVMPSRFESFGLVALEAMAHGCSVIGSNVGGLAELLQNGEAGMLVQDMNPDEFAAKIKELIDSPMNRVKYQRRGYETALNLYGPNLMANRISEFYFKVLGKNN